MRHFYGVDTLAEETFFPQLFNNPHNKFVRKSMLEYIIYLWSLFFFFFFRCKSRKSTENICEQSNISETDN